MDDVIRLTRGIHHFVRGELPFEEELKLLTEVEESEKWLNHLEMDKLIFELAQKNINSDSTLRFQIDNLRGRKR